MKKESIIVIIVMVLFLGVILSSCGSSDSPYQSDPGVDSYFKPESGLFASVTQGYMRIECDQSIFDLREDIRFTASTTYDLKNTDTAAYDEVRFVVSHSEYVEVDIDFADLKMLDLSQAVTLYDTSQGNVAFCCSTEDFDDSDLIYDPEQLPFRFNFAVSVLPDAPEEFGGKVEIRTYACITDNYLNTGMFEEDDVSQKNICKIWFYRTGDQIFFSDRSIEDAKLRAKYLG